MNEKEGVKRGDEVRPMTDSERVEGCPKCKLPRHDYCGGFHRPGDGCHTGNHRCVPVEGVPDSERVEGVERLYEITFTLWTTEDEANAAFERVSNVICGVEHGPDDECPLQWVGGMQPDPEATIPTSAIKGVIEEEGVST